MRVERFNDESFKIYLTYEDIYENGLEKEEMKVSSTKIQAILQRIIERACEEIDFYWEDSMDIEIYSLHEHGIVLLISQSLDLFSPYDELKGINDSEMSEMIVCLPSVEEVIELCIIFDRQKLVDEGSLFHHSHLYYLYLKNIKKPDYEATRAIAEEFGTLSSYSNHFLEEHGKTLVQKNAIQTLVDYFSKYSKEGTIDS